MPPVWYYDKKELRNTPSIQDGLDYETECRYRREGARFIIDMGSKMGLRYDTMATGVVYFHRFYMFHSFKEFPRYVTACCALFLAGKVEETPKKCKDIIKMARVMLSDQKFSQFGEDQKDSSLQEEVMTLERILLQTIKFDLQVEHPYTFLLKYAKCLKGDKNKLQKMVQMAWTFVNDSLCTTLCLQWEPEIIAIALMYLAGKLSKFEVVDWSGRQPKHLRWWDMFVEDITMDLLEDICHQTLDLYSQPQGLAKPESPPLSQPGQAKSPKQKGSSSKTLEKKEAEPKLSLDQKADKMVAPPAHYAYGTASYIPARYPTATYPPPPSSAYATPPIIQGTNAPPPSVTSPAGMAFPGPFPGSFPPVTTPPPPYYPPPGQPANSYPPPVPFTAAPGGGGGTGTGPQRPYYPPPS